MKAFVLDDSIKNRRGKKMEGVSSHFDHVTGRHVMGQQVLTLGLATASYGVWGQFGNRKLWGRESFNQEQDCLNFRFP